MMWSRGPVLLPTWVSRPRLLYADGPPLVIPPPGRPSRLNAYAERWVLSLRSEALDHLILVNGRHVRRVLNEFLAHYHAARAHQGLDGVIIGSHKVTGDGEWVRRKRLGGLLSYYHRRAA